MKTVFFLILGVFVGSVFLQAKSYQALTLAGKVVATYEPKESDHSPKAMVASAEAFLNTLGEDEKKQLQLSLDDAERGKWTNVPTKADDGGLRLGDLNEDQLEAGCDFLASVMSEEGYAKAVEVMLADDLLLRSEKQANRRGGLGTANFWFVIFGKPSVTEPWAIQLDGHHIAFNLTIVGEKVSMSPSFIGTQPHRFTLGGEEVVPMGEETAAAYAFINSLEEGQKKSAILSDRRGRIEAGPGRDGVIPKKRGLSCQTLNEKQKDFLLKLISLWIDDLPAQSFQTRLAEVEGQLDETFFFWQGPHQPGSDASFHIFGPSLIIEYAGQNLGGDPLNHLHSIYRDPSNEYGAKWIKKN